MKKTVCTCESCFYNNIKEGSFIYNKEDDAIFFIVKRTHSLFFGDTIERIRFERDGRFDVQRKSIIQWKCLSMFDNAEDYTLVFPKRKTTRQ